MNAPAWFVECEVDARVVTSTPEHGTLYFVAWPADDPDQLTMFEPGPGEEAGAHLIVRPDGREVWTGSGEEFARTMLGDTTTDPEDVDLDKDTDDDNAEEEPEPATTPEDDGDH